MGTNKLILSISGKKAYLTSLIGKMLKILHLIEEEEAKGYSPESFIVSQLWDLNSANELFEGELATIIIKLNGVRDGYKTLPFAQIKKQIFEIKRIIKRLLQNLEEQEYGENH